MRSEEAAVWGGGLQVSHGDKQVRKTQRNAPTAGTQVIKVSASSGQGAACLWTCG